MGKENKNIEKIQVEFFRPDLNKTQKTELYSYHIPAGFPSPAENFLEKRLDLNEFLIKNQAATFLIRVKGHSMEKAGIFDGDILVIDRSVEPSNGRIVLGVLNGEFTVKRIEKKGSKVILKPENDAFNPIELTPEMNFRIWGVVTFAIHKT